MEIGYFGTDSVFQGGAIHEGEILNLDVCIGEVQVLLESDDGFKKVVVPTACKFVRPIGIGTNNPTLISV